MGGSCPQPAVEAVLGGLEERLGGGLLGGSGPGGADDVGVVEAPLDGEGGGLVGARGVGAGAGLVALLGEGGEEGGGGGIGRRIAGPELGIDRGRRRRAPVELLGGHQHVSGLGAGGRAHHPTLLKEVHGGVDGRRRRDRAIGGRWGAAGGQAEQGQRGAGDHSSVISFSLPFSSSSIEAT